jgi:hypothetical protein
MAMCPLTTSTTNSCETQNVRHTVSGHARARPFSLFLLGRQYDRPDRSAAIKIALRLSRVLERIVGAHVYFDSAGGNLVERLVCAPGELVAGADEMQSRWARDVHRARGVESPHAHDSTLTLRIVSMKRATTADA